jgi:hypothetical protein
MAKSSPFEPFSTPNWLKPKQRDRVLRIPARLMWGFLISLIFHAILFWGFLLDLLKPLEESTQAPISVVLNVDKPAKSQPKRVEPPVEVPPEPEPKPKPQPKPQPKEVIKLPKKIIQSQNPNSTFKLPEPKPQPRPEPTPQQPPPPVEDFSSMLKRRQSERNSDEIAAKQINDAAAAAERGPSEDERRNKNIMNNLKFGTNGLFMIKRMDPYNASFSFKGWVNDYTSANTQFYEVEAKNGEDIRLIMVRRMINIIREHYNGDFDWISNRLGRTVTLSARPADSAFLEDFLMKEFFGPNYKNLDIYGH